MNTLPSNMQWINSKLTVSNVLLAAQSFVRTASFDQVGEVTYTDSKSGNKVRVFHDDLGQCTIEGEYDETTVMPFIDIVNSLLCEYPARNAYEL